MGMTACRYQLHTVCPLYVIVRNKPGICLARATVFFFKLTVKLYAAARRALDSGIFSHSAEDTENLRPAGKQ